ncbi:hypothetical protein Droror1_Dr00000916 [Drosera rotundifolia]
MKHRDRKTYCINQQEDDIFPRISHLPPNSSPPLSSPTSSFPISPSISTPLIPPSTRPLPRRRFLFVSNESKSKHEISSKDDEAAQSITCMIRFCCLFLPRTVCPPSSLVVVPVDHF